MTTDTIWYTRCPVPTAFAIALELGLFDREFEGEGIVVRSLGSSRDDAVRQSHFEHTQANSLRHGGSIPPLVTYQRGRDLRLVGLSFSPSSQPVLALPESGIRSASDLKGKRVAIPRRLNDPIDFWRATVLRGFEEVLRQAGLTFDDVVPVDLPIERRFIDDAAQGAGRAEMLWDANFMLGHQRDEANALVRGDVDAIFSQGSIATIVKAVTGAIVVARIDAVEGEAPAYGINQPFTLTISGTLADERPDIAARLVARVRQAAEWAARNEKAAKRIIAADTGLPESLVDQAYGADVHRRLDLDLSPQRIAALRVTHDDLLKHGFLDGPVDFDTFIDHRPLARSLEIAGTLA